MTYRWYYTCLGQTHGPVTSDELKRRAAEGLLQPDDLLWPEGGGRESAVEVQAAVDLEALRAGRPVAPNWLEDARKALEEARPAPGAAAPDWIEDVRATEGSRQERPPVQPDWLPDVTRAEALLPPLVLPVPDDETPPNQP
jgi:hypothetical protein